MIGTFKFAYLHFLYYFPLEFNTKITTPIKFLRNDKTQATRTYFLSELIHVYVYYLLVDFETSSSVYLYHSK